MAAKGARTVNDAPAIAPAGGADIASTLGVDAGEGWTAPAAGSAPAAGPTKVDAAKLPDVTEESVRMVLYAISGGADMAAGARVGASLTMTDGELDQLAPPLTRIVNRNVKLKVLAAQGNLMDAVAIGIGSMGYGVRIAGERMESMRQVRADEVAS